MRSTCLAAVLALTACGPITSTVTDGDYAADAVGSIPSSRLKLSTDAETKVRTGSLQLSNTTAPVALALGTFSFETGCPTNFSSVSVQSYSLSPNKLTLGGVTLQSLRLVAGCGTDGADPDSLSLIGFEALEASTLERRVFFRRVAN